MPSTELRLPIGLCLIVLLGAACSTGPPPSETPATSAVPSTATTPSIQIDIPDPGRPFDAATLLEAMRTSRRPDGVPDALETDGIAAQLAAAIWTFDGRPWTAIATGGACGPAACTFEIAGGRADTEGDDLWVFDVSPVTGTVTVASSDLRSLPSDRLAGLDRMARSLVEADGLEGTRLASVRWLPPPADGRFVLSYRSGGELGACGVDVTLDAVAMRIVSDLFVDC